MISRRMVAGGVWRRCRIARVQQVRWIFKSNKIPGRKRQSTTSYFSVKSFFKTENNSTIANFFVRVSWIRSHIVVVMAFVTARSEMGLFRCRTSARRETAAANETIHFEMYRKLHAGDIPLNGLRTKTVSLLSECASCQTKTKKTKSNPRENEWKMNTEFYRLQKFYCFR